MTGTVTMQECIRCYLVILEQHTFEPSLQYSVTFVFAPPNRIQVEREREREREGILKVENRDYRDQMHREQMWVS